MALQVLQEHPVLIAAIVGSLTLVVWLNNWFRPHPVPGIPHYPITSRWGDAPSLDKEGKDFGDLFVEGGFMSKAAKAFGPIMQVMIGPFVNFVVVFDIQEYEDVMLRSRNKCFDQSGVTRQKFDPIIPYGMVNLKQNEMWKRHRRAMAPLMGSKYLKEMDWSIATNAQLLVEFWRKKAELTYANGGKCFKCDHDFEYSTLDTISMLVVEQSIGSVNNAMIQVPNSQYTIDGHGGATFQLRNPPLFDALRYLMSIMGEDYPMAEWLLPIWRFNIYFRKQFKPSYNLVINWVDKCTEERRAAVREARSVGAEPEPAKSLAGMFAENEGVAGTEQLPYRELQDEILTFIFAGHDTTSAALQWAVKYLADAPDVQLTLRAELLKLNDSPESRALTYNDVMSDKTPFLEAVVYETLRCGQIAGGASRLSTAPVDILGHHIPKGTQLIFCYSTGSRLTTKQNEAAIRARDPLRLESSLKVGFGGTGLWDEDDVTRFKPSRWLTEDGRFNPKAGYSTPFGIGPRSCAGKALALLELRIYIATINLAFFLDKVPDALGSYKPIKCGVSSVPSMSYIAPKSWKDVPLF